MAAAKQKDWATLAADIAALCERIEALSRRVADLDDEAIEPVQPQLRLIQSGGA